MNPVQEPSTPDSATSDNAGYARPWFPVLCDATATGAVAVVIGIVIGQLADIATADILTRPTFLVNAAIAVAIAVLSAWPEHDRPSATAGSNGDSAKHRHLER